MNFNEWRIAVRDNVEQRSTSGFDWQRVSEPIWLAGFSAGIPPEQMGLAMMVARATVETLLPGAGAQPANPAEAAHVVAATAHMKGAGALGQPRPR